MRIARYSGLTVAAFVIGTIGCDAGKKEAADRAEVEQPAPLFTIGDPESEEREGGLHKVLDAWMYSADTVVVVESGSNSILIYDTLGHRIRAIGQPGAGSGEFLGLAGAYRLRQTDSIIAWDALSSRISYWTVGGTLLSDMRVSPSHFPQPRGVLADGSVIVATKDPYGRMAPSTTREIRAVLTRFKPGENTSVALDTVYWLSLAAGYSTMGTGSMMGGQPFTVGAQTAVGPDALYYTDGRAWAIIKYTFNGDGPDTLRWAGPKRILDQQARAEWLETTVAAAPQTRRPAVRRLAASLPLPMVWPAFDQLVRAQEGSVWARVSPLPADTKATWIVFDKHGTNIGGTTLPKKFKLTFISDKAIIGILPDSNDVERVVGYPRPALQAQISYLGEKDE